MKKQFVYSLAILMTIISLAACNMPSQEVTPTPLSSDAVFAIAAQTVQAIQTNTAQTQIAAVPLITNTLPPTITSTPGLPTATHTPLFVPTSTSICDQAQFVTDVTVPDGTTYSPGDTFTKTWRIKNIGTCSWTSAYTLFFSSGNAMNGPSTVALAGNVNPGQSVDVSVNLTAPATGGEYTGYWKLRNAAGLAFTSIYVKINVSGSGNDDNDGGQFAVTSVTFSVTGVCGAFHIVAQLTVNKVGDVEYHWVRSDGAEDTDPHPLLEFNEAGTKAVSTDWAVSASGDYWMDIYIDEPNHQQFGRAKLHCP